MWGYNLTETAAHTGPATSHHDGDERPRLSCHASPWGQDQSILHATDWSAACRLLAAWVAHGGMLHMTEPVLCVHTSWGGPNVCQGHSSNCCLPRVAFAGVAQRRLCALHHDRRSAAGVQQRRRVVTSRQRFFGAAMSHGHHTPHGESPGFARTRPAHPARSRPPARSHPPVLTRPFSPARSRRRLRPCHVQVAHRCHSRAINSAAAPLHRKRCWVVQCPSHPSFYVRVVSVTQPSASHPSNFETEPTRC